MFDPTAGEPVTADLARPELRLLRPWPATLRSSFYRRRGKRLLDVAFVLAGLPVILLVIVAAALAIALDGGRPFFAQDRLGQGGRVFRLWKLRTMVPDAQEALERHFAENPQARLEWETYQKLRHDPRITHVGGFLRRTSLDELPQLWNVLRGDMSLVGPRPMLPEQYALYPGKAYLELRPGLTGPWQISERHGGAFAGRGRYDDAYARDLSLAADLRIISATFDVVARAKGQ
jgi:lipopolysaccharide/colanic/teichoic acid biosynthesis glycosyltransferase